MSFRCAMPVLLLQLMMCCIVRAQPTVSGDAPTTPRLARTLRFASDQVAGWLYIRPQSSSSTNGEWLLHHEAVGEVSIPPAHEVKLALDQLDRITPHLLQFLEEDDLDELQANCPYFGPAQAALVASFSKLQSFALSSERVAPNTLTPIAQIQTLKRLDIRHVPFQDDDFAALSSLEGLEEITLPETLTSKAGPALGRLKNLRRLDLRHLAEFGDAGLLHLTALEGIEELTLPPDTTNQGLKCVVGMKSLRSLSIADTEITDAGFEHLAGLSLLETLNAGLAKVEGHGFTQLVNLPRLHTISLMSSEVTDASLARINDLPVLESLDLSGTDVTDDGMAHLAEMRSLKRLNLSHTRITSAGLASLGQAHGLEELDLTNTNISDDGLAHLAGMESLRLLNLPIQMSVPAVKQLRRKLPRCQIPEDPRFNPSPVAPATSGAPIV